MPNGAKIEVSGYGPTLVGSASSLGAALLCFCSQAFVPLGRRYRVEVARPRYQSPRVDSVGGFPLCTTVEMRGGGLISHRMDPPP